MMVDRSLDGGGNKNMKTDLDDAMIGTCENCGKTNVKVRRVKALGMFREPRGFFNICFDCFGPRIYFTRLGGSFEAPMRIKKKENEKKIA